MADDSGFDETAIGKLEAVGGNALVVRMIDLFTKLVPERLANARVALASGDMATLERLMHSMKSSAANLGASRLQAGAAEAEHLASSKSFELAEFESLLTRLDGYYATVAVTLAEKRAQRAE